MKFNIKHKSNTRIFDNMYFYFNTTICENSKYKMIIINPFLDTIRRNIFKSNTTRIDKNINRL